MKKSIFLFLLLLFSNVIFSQKKKKDKIDTEEIKVVKPYSPTVSDAFKININPVIDSVEIIEKKEINYTINSIPVASTFTPAKGKAKTLQRPPKERFYGNYASLGYGNFNTPIIEAFAHSSTTNFNDFGGFLNLHSSGGGIDGIVLDDNFLDVNVDLFYKQEERYYEWKLDAGVNHLVANWYGLSDKINYSKDVINSINEKQTYSEIYVGGEVEFFDALVHGGDVKISRFVDKANSAENYALVSGIVDFPVGNEMMYTKMTLEFLNGKFGNDFLQTDNIKYTFLNLGFSPNFEVLRDNLTLNLGAKLYYSLSNTDVGSKLYIYPNITASYNISDQALIAYAGVIGDLQQNSYKNFVKKNPFVSPTLNIERTSMQYNAYAGIKGLLNNNIRFNAKVAYISENDKALYKLNPTLTDGTNLVNKGFEAGNSFQVIYDDVNTINISGELIIDLTKEFKFGGNIEFNSYSLNTQAQAWNLPMVKATLLAKYTRKKWSAGTEMFFSSDRKDELIFDPFNSMRLTNAAYFDININAIYNINDKFSIFVNLNNILGVNYQEYTNFKVQGFQVFVGGKYKFDF
jgi:hypothetical protein